MVGVHDRPTDRPPPPHIASDPLPLARLLTRRRCRYQSTTSGSFQVVEVIETFVSYMESLERCVCIVYDTAAAAGGALGIKAIRLSEAFVEAYREGERRRQRQGARGIRAVKGGVKQQSLEIVPEPPVSMSWRCLPRAHFPLTTPTHCVCWCVPQGL